MDRLQTALSLAVESTMAVGRKSAHLISAFVHIFTSCNDSYEGLSLQRQLQKTLRILQLRKLLLHVKTEMHQMSVVANKEAEKKTGLDK